MSAVLAACGGEDGLDVPVADTGAGKAFVEEHCIGCHTLTGQGKSPEIPNLAAQPAEYLAEALHAYRDGSRAHAALKDTISRCSDDDIRNIAGYFASLPPVQTSYENETGVVDAAYEQGAEVARSCSRCHGDRGVSTTPGIPNLAGQQPVYLMVSTQEYASGSRTHAGQAEMLQGLGDVDIEKMAMYFAAQTPAQREIPDFGDVEAGEPLTAQCGACHGARGVSPDPMIPNLAGQEPVYLVNAIKAYRDKQRGHRDMVAGKDDEQIESIAAWYSIQLTGPVLDTSGEIETEIAKCDRCHGRQAEEPAMAVPVLYGQNPDYLFGVMKDYRDEKRDHSMMHKMSAGYSDSLLREIADWYSSKPRKD